MILRRRSCRQRAEIDFRRKHFAGISPQRVVKATGETSSQKGPYGLDSGIWQRKFAHRRTEKI